MISLTWCIAKFIHHQVRQGPQDGAEAEAIQRAPLREKTTMTRTSPRARASSNSMKPAARRMYGPRCENHFAWYSSVTGDPSVTSMCNDALRGLGSMPKASSQASNSGSADTSRTQATAASARVQDEYLGSTPG